MIFSLDAAIAFTISLILLLLFSTTLASAAQKAEQNIKNYELEEKALLIADSFVKNYNAQNTTLGSCTYAADKKRVKTNELTSANIKNAKKTSFGEIYVKNIYFETNTRKENIQLETKNSNECVSAKRFVLIDGEKGMIEMQVCRGE